jgi:osmotically-inducible protein OsmY
MSTATLTETDKHVRDDVVRQLEWDPEVDASAIGVVAARGVVTLTGSIDSYAGKLAAERAAKQVHGVRGVANELEVRLIAVRSDADITADAVRALELRATVPDTVQAAVHHGHVTLTGTVAYLAQSRAAESAVRHVKGVRGIFNHIEVATGAVRRDVRKRIAAALHRDATVQAQRVSLSVDGDVVTLSGVVATCQQRDAAEQAAAKASGITRVVNQIVVEPVEAVGPVEPLDEIC